MVFASTDLDFSLIMDGQTSEFAEPNINDGKVCEICYPYEQPQTEVTVVISDPCEEWRILLVVLTDQTQTVLEDCHV